MNPELILNDKFVEFSAKVTELHAKKKSLIADFRVAVKAIDEEAVSLQNEFSTWQQSQQQNLLPKAKKD